MTLKLFRLIFRIPIYDTQCGFKAFKKKVWLDLRKNFVVTGYAFDADFIVNILRNNYKLAVVPVVFEKRYAGYSKIKLIHRISMLIDLFKIAVFSNSFVTQ